MPSPPVMRSNVRVYKHDAVEVLENEIAPGSLDEVRIWFPDPWHKKRHNKRRIIQPEFVAMLASRMAPDGLLHLATDWQAYAEHMLEVMEAAPDWRNQLGPGSYAEKPDVAHRDPFRASRAEARTRRVGPALPQGLTAAIRAPAPKAAIHQLARWRAYTSPSNREMSAAA